MASPLSSLPVGDHTALYETSLLKYAEAAELLPYVPAEPPASFSSTCNHLHRVGGFFFTLANGGLAGQALPPQHQTWLTFAAFDHLTVIVRDQSKIDPHSKLATLLRRRMRFLELLARVARTSQCDWQTSLEHRHEVVASTKHALQFNWCSVIRKLTGDTWAAPHTQRALASLRFGHPKFLIQWDHDPIPDNFPDMLEIFLMGVATGDEENDDDPLLVDDALRSLLKEQETKTGPTYRVVELGLALCGGRVTTSLLFSIIEVLERFGEAQKKMRAKAMSGKQPTAKIEFRVTALMFSELCTIAGSALEHLGDLVRGSENLHIEEIKIVRLGSVEDLSLQRCISDLIVPAAQQSTNTLRFSIENDSKPLASVAATVRYDTSFREIATTYAASEMDSLAAWLAFGFFHADSTSAVETLRIRMPGHVDYDDRVSPYTVCTPRFVEIFRRVLSRVVSPEDLAPLDPKTTKNMKRKRGDQTVESPLDELPLPEDKRVVVEVQADTKARRQPQTASAIIATLAESSEEEDESIVTQFQVVRQLRGWVAVVVPGFGAGWIPRKAVVKELTLPTRVVSSTLVTRRRVKSFSWVGGSLPNEEEIKIQHAASLVELFALIGGHLEALHLPHMALHNQHVAPILQHCPNLKELNLFGNRITDMAPLVEAYEQGTCQVSTLSVAQHGEVHDRVATQCAEILKLCNQHKHTAPTSVTRPTLKQLVLRLTPFDYDRIEHYTHDVIPLVYKTIMKDPKLEYVRIHCDTDDYAHLLHQLDDHKNELVALRTAAPQSESAAAQTQDKEVIIADGLRSRPLPLASKLAMVSVVHHASTQQSALSGMDGGVLATIFGLAGTSQPRVLDIAADQIYI